MNDFDESEENTQKEDDTKNGEDIVQIRKENPIAEKEKYNGNNNIRSNYSRGTNATGNNKEKKSQISQIYDLDNDEKNELSFERALRYDDRSFCKYYYFLLQNGHIIFSIFCRDSAYNIFSVKLGLLFMLFPINLATSIFFFW